MALEEKGADQKRGRDIPVESGRSASRSVALEYLYPCVCCFLIDLAENVMLESWLECVFGVYHGCSAAVLIMLSCCDTTVKHNDDMVGYFSHFCISVPSMHAVFSC